MRDHRFSQQNTLKSLAAVGLMTTALLAVAEAAETAVSVGGSDDGLREGSHHRVSFQDPVVTKGADESIVRHVESAVIIPGDTHNDLWVHPNLVTVPGDPIVIELALRSTDRRGGDRHTVFNYFRTDDYFQTLRPIAEPTAAAWKRIGLTPDDLAPPPDAKVQVPRPPRAQWHWARNYVHIDANTVLHPFLVAEGRCHSVQTLAAKLDGERIVPWYLSNAWSNHQARGLLEPQIAEYEGRYYMTVRAEDKRGYVLVSEDNGRTWSCPAPWRWDCGEEILMHTTMTKLLSHSDGLVLVYTRIRDDNANVFRNRAPLHCADLDPRTLTLRRSTERILVSNKGLPVGNFWVWPIDQQQSYVVVAEWPRDGRNKNGDTWLAKIYWKRPNRQLTRDGRELAAVR